MGYGVLLHGAELCRAQQEDEHPSSCPTTHSVPGAATNIGATKSSPTDFPSAPGGAVMMVERFYSSLHSALC